MTLTYLDFEKSIADLDARIRALKTDAETATLDISPEVQRLEAKARKQLESLYQNLTPWQKALVARHPARPTLTQIISELIDEFVPLAGDRSYADDPAIMGGLGRFRGRSVVVLGHEKGADTRGRIRHNFGMAKPEGYRKAARVMDLADRFNLPIISLVNTPGAFPGIEAEERGQAEAIARCTQACMDVSVPIVAVIVGEGGSGGAVALAAGNHVSMFEHAIYSVISPEGCASILWRTAEKAADAAQALKLTAQDLKRLGVIDEVIPEPVGGAHREIGMAIKAMTKSIDSALAGLTIQSRQQLRDGRREKFLAIGRLAA